MPEAIFFDWDGTLVDSYPFIESAHNHALKILGMGTKQPEWFRYYFGRDRDFIYRNIYGELAQQAQTHFEKFFVENHTRNIQTITGAEELLRTLFEHNVTLGVVTNKRGDFVAKEIEKLGWKDLFAVVVGAGEAEEDKPSDAPLRRAVELSEQQGKEILYVGDTGTDLTCAKNYGCPSVLIHPNHEQLEWLGEHEPLHVTKDCQGLEEFLLQTV